MWLENCKSRRKRYEMSSPHPVLAKDSVNFVGDHVAVVIAETLEQAKNAAELVNVNYKFKKQ